MLFLIIDIKKIECFENCYERCIYQSNILGPENHQFWPSKNDISNELRSHNHPIHRRFGNVNRTVEDAVLELVQHYKYAHDIHI